MKPVVVYQNLSKWKGVGDRFLDMVWEHKEGGQFSKGRDQAMIKLYTLF